MSANKEVQDTKAEIRRKRYEAPRMARYGEVERLTQSGGSTQPDAHQARQVHPGS